MKFNCNFSPRAHQNKPHVSEMTRARRNVTTLWTDDFSTLHSFIFCQPKITMTSVCFFSYLIEFIFIFDTLFSLILIQCHKYLIKCFMYFSLDFETYKNWKGAAAATAIWLKTFTSFRPSLKQLLISHTCTWNASHFAIKENVVQITVKKNFLQVTVFDTKAMQSVQYLWRGKWWKKCSFVRISLF